MPFVSNPMALKSTRAFCLSALFTIACGVHAQDQPPSEQPAGAQHTPRAEVPGAGGGILIGAGDPEAGQAKSTICATCHGPDGNSTNPAWPKLAGQHVDYFVAELQAFKSGARQNPLMSPQATTLTEQDMLDLAAYYAQRAIQPGVADETLVAAGRDIYRGGIPESEVPGCIACHGPAGRGIPAAGFPLIGGQHALYTLTSLQAYASGQRQSPNNIMNDIASRLSEAEMQAVASYVEGLHLNQAAFEQTD